jgi:hypothetical protein
MPRAFADMHLTCYLLENSSGLAFCLNVSMCATHVVFVRNWVRHLILDLDDVLQQPYVSTLELL